LRPYAQQHTAAAWHVSLEGSAKDAEVFLTPEIAHALGALQAEVRPRYAHSRRHRSATEQADGFAAIHLILDHDDVRRS